MTFPPKVALEVYTQHKQPQASQVGQQSFRKVTERNSSGQPLRISVGLLVLKNRGKAGWKGEKGKKKGKREKRKGSRGREHSFPIYMHSQNRAESLATRKRTVDSGWGPPPPVSDRPAGSPASPVGFALLGHLLCQFLQNSFFQSQILSKWKAVQVPCNFAHEP